MAKKQLRGMVKSPTGREHALPTLEEAARLVVIVNEDLTKDNFDEIIEKLTENPNNTFTWNGWVVGVDTTTRRTGQQVKVVKLDGTGERVFGSIKEASTVLGLPQQKIRTLINGFTNIHDGMRFTKHTDGW